MTKAYIIRDSEDVVIGQYYSDSEPSKPDRWEGDWIVEKVDLDDLNSEPVQWWDEQ